MTFHCQSCHMAQQGLSDCCKFETYMYHYSYHGSESNKDICMATTITNITSGSNSKCMQSMASLLSYSVHSKSLRCAARMKCPLQDAWVDSMENKLSPMQYVPTLHINKVTKGKAKASTTWHLVMSQKFSELAYIC